MLVRESTDHASPLAIERYSAGFRAPLLTTATGRVYLANSPAPQRDTLIEILARSNKEEDKPARSRAELQRMLAEIKVAGYATATRTRRLVEEISLSVPVLLAGPSAGQPDGALYGLGRAAEERRRALFAEVAPVRG